MTALMTEIRLGDAIALVCEEALQIALRREAFDQEALPAPLREGALDHLRGEAHHIWLRIILEEFHRYRVAHPVSTPPSEGRALESFISTLREGEGTDSLIRRWPNAVELLATRVRLHREALSELAAAWRQDRTALERAAMMRAGAQVRAVEFGAGDSHHGARTVALLTLDDGTRLVHKPRSAAPDRALEALLGAAGRLLGEDLTPCAPRTLAGHAGSWQEFITTRQPATHEQVRDYYRRFGFLSGLFAALGTGDLHHENVLVRGAYPCVIDAETLLQPGLGEVDTSLGSELLLAGEHSPGSTLMLPVRVRTGAFDVLVCALGIPWPQESRKETFALADDGTDDVRMVRTPMHMVHEANVLTPPGEQVNPLDYTDALEEGYLSAHRLLKDHLHEILGAVSGQEEAAYRVVLRPTEVYAKFVDASVQAQVLSDAAQRDALLGRVRDIDREDGGRVVHAERSDLARLDVPAFHVSANQRCLRHGAARVSGDYFAASPLGNARATATRFADRSATFHRFMLETTLGELAVGTQRRYPRPLLGEYLHQDPGRTAQSLLEAFAQTAVRGSTPEGTGAAWLAHLGHDNLETLELDRALTLHDQGGLVQALCAHAPQSSIAKQARAGLSLRLPPEPGYAEISVIAGPLQELLVGGNIDLEQAAPISGLTLETATNLDVVRGLAGLLLAASAKPGQDETWIARALDALQDAHRRVTWTRLWCDLAHGEMGSLWAQLRATARLGGSIHPLAQELLDGIRATCEQGWRTPGWCSGAAGGLIVLSELHNNGIRVPEAVRDAVAEATSRVPEGIVDLSLCHGVSGQIQSLLYAAQSGLLPDGEGLAHRLWETGVAQAHEAGLQTGVPGRTTILGLFLGWAGIYDTAARLSGSPNSLNPVAFLPEPEEH